MEGEQHYIISDLKQNGEKHKEIIILQLNKILLDKSMSSFIMKNCDDKMKNKGYKLLKNSIFHQFFSSLFQKIPKNF